MADGDLAACHLDLHLVGMGREVWYHAGCLGPSAADATISQRSSLPGNRPTGVVRSTPVLRPEGGQDEGVEADRLAGAADPVHGPLRQLPADRAAGAGLPTAAGFQHVYRSSSHLLPCRWKAVLGDGSSLA